MKDDNKGFMDVLLGLLFHAQLANIKIGSHILCLYDFNACQIYTLRCWVQVAKQHEFLKTYFVKKVKSDIQSCRKFGSR